MATLHASRFTLHASRFIKGFRSAALIGVASLSLAACGGGDSTVQTQQPKTDPVPPVEPDCTATPRPPSCPPITPPEPTVPVPFAALGRLETAYAVAAIRKTKLGIEKDPLFLMNHAEYLQITALKHGSTTTEEDVNPEIFVQNQDSLVLRGTLTKVAKVEHTGNVDWRFELWHTGVLVSNSGDSRIELSESLGFTGSEKIFSLEKGDYTAKDMDFSFDEPYDNAIKNYQILTAEVDTDNNRKNDATLYAELWTNYPSDETYYMSGGMWLLVPMNVSQNEAYDFGAFVRSNYHTESTTNNLVFRSAKGTARYKGSAVGLYASLGENNDAKISRLLGKVTIDADFGTERTRGSLDGKIHDLTLDGKQVQGEILLNRDLDNLPSSTYSIGNVNGINFTGINNYTILDGTSKESSMKALMGTIGGTGENGDTVVGTWGAYKVEDGE